MIEAADNGYDKLITDVSFTLGEAIEELQLRVGGAAIQGTGNALNNKILGNQLANQLWGEDGIDQIFAGLGDDFVYGGQGADQLSGDAGNDVLYGGDGNDKLYGGAGQDTLYGGAGNDQMNAGADGGDQYGGAGNDLMGAGAGADVFHFSTGCETDTIKGFNAAQDRLVFTGIDAEDLLLVQKGGQLIITWGTSDKVLISNWVAPSLDPDQLPFDFF